MTEGAISFRDHSAETDIASFRCGVREIDTWFRSKSLKDHGSRKHIVTCAYEGDDVRKPVGFYALSTVIEEARLLQGTPYVPFFGNPNYFPCLSMVYLAVTQHRQSQGIGSTIMAKLISDFAGYGEKIGLPLLILTPVNKKAAGFYEGLGFEPYNHGMGMFLSLQAAIDMRAQLQVV